MKKSLRPILAAGNAIGVPGVGDALGALLAAEAGFPMAYMSGYFASSLLGHLDVGLISSTEMVSQVARICAAVDLPILADADTGYGNAINVIRTVREFESAGAAGIHIEDQTSPKKCGHMDGQLLISSNEMCMKVAAALDARADKEFVIIARTDALGTHGVEEAIRRGREYRNAGADALMVVAPRSLDDLKRFRDGVEGPLVTTVGAWSFNVSIKQMDEIGYAIALYTVSSLRRSVAVVRELLAALKKDGFLEHAAPAMASMEDLHKLLGKAKIQEWEKRYSAKE